MIDKITERYEDSVFIKLDGLDEAIIGVYEKDSDIGLIYSEKKCIKILSKNMTKDDAYEFFYFNIVNVFYGEKMPIICFDDF